MEAVETSPDSRLDGLFANLKVNQSRYFTLIPKNGFLHVLAATAYGIYLHIIFPELSTVFWNGIVWHNLLYLEQIKFDDN